MQKTGMVNPIIRSRVDATQLPRRRIQKRRRTPRHLWSEDELGLLIYLRSQGWDFKDIQEKHFPTIALDGVRGAHARRVQLLIRQREISLTSPTNTRRYNLRSRKPICLQKGRPRCVIDQRRFPHFSDSYKKYIRLDPASDKDYKPPERSPTPADSNCSASTISTQLSSPSSLELFGLEARSRASSERQSPELHTPCISISSQLSDTTDSEFYSSVEQPSSP